MRNLKILLLFFFCIASFSTYSANDTTVDEAVMSLDKELKDRQMYVNQKKNTIDSLQQQLNSIFCAEDTCKYRLYSELSDEYRSFLYDSAFVYTQKMVQTASVLNDEEKIMESKIKLSFVLLSSGLFTEAKEILDALDLKNAPKHLLLDYYTIAARVYYDLAIYANDFYYLEKYNEIGNKYQNYVIENEKDPTLKLAAIAMQDMKKKNFSSAIRNYEMLLNIPNLTNHEIAIAASSLGYLYSLSGEKDKAIIMMVKAAIADIKSATKETVALRNLASMMFVYGDKFEEKAYDYIEIAYEDAQYYNARHRMAEVSTVLPIIQKERIKNVEAQRNQYIRFFIAMCLLVLIALIFLFIIFKQYRKLSETKDLIMKSNADLQKANQKLQESNKIKDEYIGYFFRMNSDFIQKLTTVRKKVAKLIANREFDKLKNVISDEDLDLQREELFQTFDKIFLKLFPTFIDDFNSFFAEEDRIILNKSELMNTDLRIFALIRLGIKDNEDIAEFLNYSVNTIYTYKTRIKNKSLVDNDEFEKKIMKIKAV